MSRYLRYAMATSNLQQTLLVPLFSANGTLFIFLDRGSFIRRQWTTVASRALEHVATCDNLPGICLPVSNSPSWLRSDQWGKGSSLGDSWKYSPAHIRESHTKKTLLHTLDAAVSGSVQPQDNKSKEKSQCFEDSAVERCTFLDDIINVRYHLWGWKSVDFSSNKLVEFWCQLLFAGHSATCSQEHSLEVYYIFQAKRLKISH